MQAMMRKAMFVAGLVVVSATGVEAQDKREKEVRLDMAALMTSDGSTNVAVGFPQTSVALAVYLNKKVAIEPNFGFSVISSDLVDGQTVHLGAMVPYYFAADGGRSGLFVSPGLELSKGMGDFDSDLAVDYGVDFGFRKVWRDNLSWRGALTLRDGDSHTDVALGASFGLGLFWK